LNAILSSEQVLRLRGLARLLHGFAYRFANEAQLQEAVAGVLTDAGYTFERECVLDDKNRADFYLQGLVIELKVDGALSSALRQIDRYSHLDNVDAVLLASTERWADQSLQGKAEFHHKPFEMVRLRRHAL
jgi:hypothetical protein